MIASASGRSGQVRAQSDTYPSKPVKVVIPTSPGGGADIRIRALSPKLADRWKQPLVVDNRPGAGGSLAAAAVARAAPDGYTLLFAVSGSLVLAPSLIPNIGYDPIRDFEPVALMGIGARAFGTRADAPWKTVDDFVAAARARPGKLTIASGNPGSSGHLAVVMLKAAADLDLVYVPYKDDAPAMTDTLSGHVDAVFTTPLQIQPMAKAGKARVLAVAAPARLPAFPDVPTFAESGLKGVEAQEWLGFLCPAGTPRAIVERLNADVDAVLALPDIREFLLNSGAQPSTMSRAEFARFIASEHARNAQLIRANGIKAE